jgi:sigma-B regulation protein RsbU (phosphoserine phosphatase)
MKWLPARRVLLLIAVILLIFQPDIRIGGNEVGLGLGWVGAVILFDLLALELGDRVTMKRDLEFARDSTMAGPRSSAACFWNGYRLRHPQNTVAGDHYDAFLRPVPGGQSRQWPARRDRCRCRGK